MKKFVKMLVVVMMIVALLPTSVFAASSGRPYKDVTKKSVGKSAYTAIVYCKKHAGYKDVVSGKKFYPKRKITRAECLTIAENFYGKDKISKLDNKWFLRSSKKATPKWLTGLFVAIADNCFGMSITWNEKSTKVMTRALASQYFKVAADFDSAFKPRK